MDNILTLCRFCVSLHFKCLTFYILKQTFQIPLKPEMLLEHFLNKSNKKITTRIENWETKWERESLKEELLISGLLHKRRRQGQSMEIQLAIMVWTASISPLQAALHRAGLNPKREPNTCTHLPMTRRSGLNWKKVFSFHLILYSCHVDMVTLTLTH